MSAFIGLNSEPEAQVQEEVDDTKEIQLEEAFKLYQNALKLHSQAYDQESYRDAFSAYQELFRSEVFKYPEVVTGYANDNLDDILVSGFPEVDQESSTVPTGPAAETSATSIPLLIYLAFKNRGQFVIDVAKFKLQDQEPGTSDTRQYYAKSCSDSLKDFADSLERDDTDLDLWKKAARVAEVLSIPRIARFCFESVFAGDDDTFEQAVDLSGLDEAYAFGELRDLLSVVQDDLSIVQNGSQQAKSKLLKILQKTDDPYPYLPQRSQSLEYVDDRHRPLGSGVERRVIQVANISQEDLGCALLQALQDYQDGKVELGPGSAIVIEVPENLKTKYNEQPINPTNIDVNHQGEQSGPNNVQSLVQSPERSGDDVPNTTTSDKRPAETVLHPDSEAHGNNAHSTSSQVDNDSQAKVKDQADSADPVAVAQETQTITNELPTRKRSSTVAGNEEPESRAKSKRLRARDSLADLPAHDDDAPHDLGKYYQDQLRWYVDMDTLFLDQCGDLYGLLGLEGYDSIANISKDFWGQPLDTIPQKGDSATNARLLSDLKLALTNWSDGKTQALLHGHGNQDFVEKSTGLALFLQHSKVNPPKEQHSSVADSDAAFFGYVNKVNDEFVHINEAVLEWLKSLLIGHVHGDLGKTSSYLREEWSAELKQCVVQLIIRTDEHIYSRMHDFYLQRAHVTVNGESHPARGDSIAFAASSEFAQTVFELHLDIQAAINNPSSQVDEVLRLQQADRVGRWAQLTTSLLQSTLATSQETLEQMNILTVRFLWSSVTCAEQSEDTDKAQVMLCLDDLRRILELHNSPAIPLPNNLAMPLISVAAIEKEKSRLSTLDFFVSVFDTDNSDPIAVIEKLEPILEPKRSRSEPMCGSSDLLESSENHETQELIDFLDSGDAALRLFLWRRLQNAYTAISYTPKVVSCLLRSMEIIVKELQSLRHASLESEDRQMAMLRWFKDADDILGKVLTKAVNEPTALDFLDDQHIQSSLIAIRFLATVLHGFAIFEDSVRIGQITLPVMKSVSANKAFEKGRDKLREILVRLWTLQYVLLKEGLKQKGSAVEKLDDRLAHYLNAAHRALGYRQYCRCSNKAFVRLARNELLILHPIGDFTAEIAQVLYDLYRVKVYIGLIDEHHDCPFENVDKKTATALLPFIMNYANRLNMRDLVKSDMKVTIDKIQHAMGSVKSNAALSQNKKMITSYLRAVINPTELYRCIKGIGDIPTKAVHSETAKIASSGWFFLLGHMPLARYKSTKRITPSYTEDLDIAAQYLRYDLEHGSENWEAWYRLAQVYDAKIEDDLIWNSTKLNESRSDIAVNERCAIHAYSMATALAMRTADDQAETARKVEEMFADFAIRLYASSRPPLNMEAFRTDKHMRHMSSTFDQSMSKEPYCRPMQSYVVWHFAAYLLQRKLSDRAKPWLTHYTLGKCLWKMLRHPDRDRARRPVNVESVISAFIVAIEASPKKEKVSEYILEPHFKLVSTVHKLVRSSLLEPARGYEVLQATRFAHGIDISDDEQGNPEWDAYMLEILKRLGSADKSNWHHRIIARAAHVIYDDQPDLAGALGAKHEFTQQIFTKTMTLQVWKPEFERPGRHYVYTGRYVLFFMKLLDQLNDRSSFDQLLRRIRRKQTDFIDHEKIWEDAATTYVKLLRRIGKVPEGQEKAVFDSVNYEDFIKNSEKVEAWAHDPETSSIVVDIMADAIELKKLNNSLMKGPLIDDLIGDAYADLYKSHVSLLPVEETEVLQPPAPAIGTFINLTTNHAPSGDDNLDRMRLGSVLSSQIEGCAVRSYERIDQPLLGLGLQTPPHAMGATQPVPVLDPGRVLTPSKPGRAKTITRREIQRKAEAAIVKPPPIKTPTLSKKPIIEIPARRHSLDSNAEVAANPMLSNVRDEDGLGSRPSSRQSSTHDSADLEAGADADDESGSSDMADETAKSRSRSLFPGLQAQQRSLQQDSDAGETDDEDDAKEDIENEKIDQQEVEIAESQDVLADENTPAAYETADEDQPESRG